MAEGFEQLEVGYIDQLFGNKWISETKQISAMLSSFMSVKKYSLRSK